MYIERYGASQQPRNQGQFLTVSNTSDIICYNPNLSICTAPLFGLLKLVRLHVLPFRTIPGLHAVFEPPGVSDEVR